MDKGQFYFRSFDLLQELGNIKRKLPQPRIEDFQSGYAPLKNR